MDEFDSSTPDAETPAESATLPVVQTETDAAVETHNGLTDGSTDGSRSDELVAKGKLFEKLESLPIGSEITISPSSQVIGARAVRIKVKGDGVHATYLHGDSIASALAPPEQA